VLKTSTCPSCDLIVRLPALMPGQSARCPRCRHVLVHAYASSPQTTLALSLSGLLLLFPANLYPMLTMSLLGQSEVNTLFAGILALWREKFHFVALLVGFCAIVAPFFYLLFLSLVSLILLTGTRPPWLRSMLKVAHHLRHWSMLEVYLVSFLVAVVKLVDFSEVTLGAGALCFTLLMMTVSSLVYLYDQNSYWEVYENSAQ